MFSGVPFSFDSSTRAGKGPEWNCMGTLPLLVSTTHGTYPQWASIIYQNTIPNPQELRFRLHNLDHTPPTDTSPAVYTQVFLVPIQATTLLPQYEIYNVGLIPTETWESPTAVVVNPGYFLLAICPSSPAGISVNLDIHTIV